MDHRPGAMLLFTLEMGRYEPRLFDEVLDWLVINGRWIDLQRLRGILHERQTMIQLTRGRSLLSYEGK